MTNSFREGPHLVARLFDVLSARALRPQEQHEVATLLNSDSERAIFWEQSRADQRHGLGAARHVTSRIADRRDLTRAALLHDVGKRHARLGIVGRIAASLVRVVGRRGSGRIGMYLDHGQRSAMELELAGAESVVVQFARHHHGSRPAGIPESDWAVLVEADGVRR